MRARRPERGALSTQLAMAYGGVALLLALAIGVPAATLLKHQLTAQSDARVRQASASTAALLASRVGETKALVALIAQRPTLRRLVTDGADEALVPYVETLRDGAGLDAIVVTDAAGREMAGARRDGAGVPAYALMAPETPSVTTGGVSTVAGGDAVHAALVASAPVLAGDQVLGTVAGWVVLDDERLVELSEHTGLEHAIFVDGERTASSSAILPKRLEEIGTGFQEFAGRSRYVTVLPLSAAHPAVLDVLALPTEDVAAGLRQVMAGMAVATAMAGLLAVSLALVTARRMAAPLGHLVTAARGMARGDLSRPVRVRQGVQEVDVLAETLETMRARLSLAQEDLRASKRWSEGLIEALAEGVVTLDDEGRVTSYSSGAERILGWRTGDVIGRAWASVLQPSAGPAEAQSVPPARVPVGTAMRVAATRADGEPVALIVTAGAVTQRRGGGDEHVLVFRDVTEEERALRQRETLLSSLTHELVTPLAALIAAAELLQDLARDAGDEALDQLTQSIMVGTLRLREMVDNLLSSAGLHTGHFAVDLQPMDLADSLEEVRVAIAPLLAAKGQYLRIDCPAPSPRVMADARRLSQVLVNLLSNASRYGPLDRPIELRARRHGEVVWVEVADHGPGVAPELLPQLFKPFSRGRGADSSGVGLGLTIVKSIVERHGGTVRIEAEPGGGARVRFSLRALCRVGPGA